MKKKILWLTQSAMLLALLVTLQWLTKPLSQLITGTCVNGVLAVACLMVGLTGGLTVALISPLMALWLGIAPNAVVVPAIMVGNTLFVLLLRCICRKNIARNILGLVVAAAAKFAAMYALVVWVLAGPAAPPKLLATFSWPQLVTALAGGGLALLIVPALKKALHRKSN